MGHLLTVSQAIEQIVQTCQLFLPGVYRCKQGFPVGQKGLVGLLLQPCLQQGRKRICGFFFATSIQEGFSHGAFNQFQSVTSFLFLSYRTGKRISNTYIILKTILERYGNKEIFVDKGCYFYNQSLDIKNEYIRTSSHNTVYIHGFEQADYVGPGWYNYPETAVSNEYSPNSIFDGSIRYKDVKHHRIIQYLKPKMIIHDKIFKPSMAVAHYHYLLHESIDVKRENDNALNLFYKNKILAKVVIEGANVEIREEAYYPHYANKIYTKAIIGLLNSDKVTTIIEFYK